VQATLSAPSLSRHLTDCNETVSLTSPAYWHCPLAANHHSRRKKCAPGPKRPERKKERLRDALSGGDFLSRRPSLAQKAERPAPAYPRERTASATAAIPGSVARPSNRASASPRLWGDAAPAPRPPSSRSEGSKVTDAVEKLPRITGAPPFGGSGRMDLVQVERAIVVLPICPRSSPSL